MSTGPITHQGWLPGPRLIAAELLKLRKRKGLMIASLVITSGAMIVVFAILASLHAARPLSYGPAGGVSHLHGFGMGLGMLGSVAAILIGAAAGAGDLSAGVFRNLVTTGRSSVALFLARVPAGLAVTVLVVGLAYLLVAIGVSIFAGHVVERPTGAFNLSMGAAIASSPAPTIGQLVSWGLWIELQAVMYFLVALGFASLVPNQAVTLGVLLAWDFVLTQILIGVQVLGDVRQLVFGVALDQLRPNFDSFSGTFENLRMSTTSTAAVLVAWVALAMGIGMWRTAKRDA
jgi:hypothetical protein